MRAHSTEPGGAVPASAPRCGPPCPASHLARRLVGLCGSCLSPSLPRRSGRARACRERVSGQRQGGALQRAEPGVQIEGNGARAGCGDGVQRGRTAVVPCSQSHVRAALLWGCTAAWRPGGGAILAAERLQQLQRHHPPLPPLRPRRCCCRERGCRGCAGPGRARRAAGGAGSLGAAEPGAAGCSDSAGGAAAGGCLFVRRS